MAFDDKLAERVRVILGPRPDVTERKMFGGLAFMLGGNMCCGIVGDELMARVGPEAYERLLARKHARQMDFTGRSLKGMLYVARAGLRTRASLAGWVGLCVDFAGSLPAKTGRARPKAPRRQKR